MDALMPWNELQAEIEPVYPRKDNGRPPYLLRAEEFLAA